MIIKEAKINCGPYQIFADRYDGDSKNIVVCFNGYTSTKKRYESMNSTICEKTGYSALVVDLSGHGVSAGKLEDISIAHHFVEANYVIDWVEENYPGATITVMGTSYGGYMAGLLATERDIARLLLRVPAIYDEDNFYKQAKEWRADMHQIDYRQDKNRLSQNDLFKKLAEFEGKAFVIQHELDDVCPKDSTDAFVEALGADAWVYPGIGHGFLDAGLTEDDKQEYYKKMAAWISAN